LLYALLAPSLPPAVAETITLLLVELLTGGARLSALSSAYTPNTSYTAAGDSGNTGSSSVPMSPATTAAASPGVGGGTSGGGWEVGLSEDLHAVLYMLVSTLSKQVRSTVVVSTRDLASTGMTSATVGIYRMLNVCFVTGTHGRNMIVADVLVTDTTAPAALLFNMRYRFTV
jgi:hypothetical protein